MISAKIGSTSKIDIAARDGDGVLITNLADADALEYMIKENATDADLDALVSKTLGAGIEVDTPVTGSVRVTIDPGDLSTATPGEKFHALKITWGTVEIEIDLFDDHVKSDKILLVQGVIR